MQPGDAATWASVIVALVVGGLGFLVGGIGLVIAGLARADSRRANRIATESNRIAVEANEIARASSEAANETSDVGWRLDWIEPGVARLVNTGTDPACWARGEVTVDGEMRRFPTIERIEPENGPTLRFPAAADAFDAEQFPGDNRLNEWAGGVIFINPNFRHDHAVTWRVQWRGPLGKPFEDSAMLPNESVWPPKPDTGPDPYPYPSD